MKRSSDVNLEGNAIDLFDLAAGEYFAVLYAAFPVRISLETHPRELNELKIGKLILPDLRYRIDTYDFDYEKIHRDINIGHELETYSNEKERRYYEELEELKNSIPEMLAMRKYLEDLSLIRSETADWLNKSGYISIDNKKEAQWDTSIRWASECDTLRGDQFQIYDGAAVYTLYEGARLTTKGLEILRAVPPMVSETGNRKSVGGQLVDQMKDGAVDMRQSVVSNLVEQVFSIGVRVLKDTL